MARLEELTIGSVVTGLLAGEPITVVSTKWYILISKCNSI